jgi:hypothetical protein
MRNTNYNSILLVFEGITDRFFYRRIKEFYFSDRKIRISGSLMYGQSNITRKAENFIESYLEENRDLNSIHVFITHDREGTREKDSMLDLAYLHDLFLSDKKSRIASINEIIATQDIESWFFADIDGVYKYLKVPKKRQNVKKFNNIESTNNRILSILFHQCNNTYSKGYDSENLINSLDIKKIVENVKELTEAVNFMIGLKNNS